MSKRKHNMTTRGTSNNNNSADFNKKIKSSPLPPFTWDFDKIGTNTTQSIFEYALGSIDKNNFKNYLRTGTAITLVNKKFLSIGRMAFDIPSCIINPLYWDIGYNEVGIECQKKVSLGFILDNALPRNEIIYTEMFLLYCIILCSKRNNITMLDFILSNKTVIEIMNDTVDLLHLILLWCNEETFEFARKHQARVISKESERLACMKNQLQTS